ncbi:MAG: FkbM family methyltransferase [Hyphomicrobiales bacterium]
MTISGRLRDMVVDHLPRVAFLMARFNHVHDEGEIALLPFLVDPQRQAIDVGANIGRYTLPLSRRATHVHAFEPHPRLAAVLRATFQSRATIYQAAASDRNGMTQLHIPLVDGREDQGIASVETGAFDETFGVSFESLDVRTLTLDSLSDCNIGFIKIDVEGHELSVLQGAEKLLAHWRPTVLVEVEERHSPGAFGRVTAFFDALNYRGFFLFDSALRPLSEFLPDMQNPLLLRVLDTGAPRKAIPYVNNFIFIPDEASLDQRIATINAQLAKTGRY